MDFRKNRAAIAGAVLALAAGVAFAAPVRTLAQGQQSAIREPQRTVVRTSADWKALWSKHGGDGRGAPPLPPVDFSREMVLATFLGTRRTAGYAVRIGGAAEEAKKLVVRVSERKPRPGAITAQVITAPFHIVAVPKSALPVVWKEEAAGEESIRRKLGKEAGDQLFR